MKVYTVESVYKGVEDVFDSFEKADKFLTEEWGFVKRNKLPCGYDYVDNMENPETMAWITAWNVK